MDRLTCHRRAVLRSVGVATAAGVAGCMGGDGEDDAPESADDTVSVGPDNNTVYDREELEVDPGTTVAFVWESGGHSIDVVSQPDGGGWAGVDGLESEGHVHEYTFEEEGRYEYQCSAHHVVGMTGAIIVGDGG